MFQLSLPHRALHSFPTRRSSDLVESLMATSGNCGVSISLFASVSMKILLCFWEISFPRIKKSCTLLTGRSEEHTSELQSRGHLVCRLLLEKKKQKRNNVIS